MQQTCDKCGKSLLGEESVMLCEYSHAFCKACAESNDDHCLNCGEDLIECEGPKA